MLGLKKGLISVLKNLYPEGYRFYGIEITEGYEKPSFFTQIIPVTTEVLTKNMCNNTVLFVITYFQKKTDEADTLKKINEIKKAYGLKVKAEDRYINVNELEADYIGENGNILQITISISYMDKITSEEKDHEIIRELTLKMED